jgi:hypothetical protein
VLRTPRLIALGAVVAAGEDLVFQRSHRLTMLDDPSRVPEAQLAGVQFVEECEVVASVSIVQTVFGQLGPNWATASGASPVVPWTHGSITISGDLVLASSHHVAGCPVPAPQAPPGTGACF